MDAEYVRDFFNTGKEAKEGKLLPATILSVEGRNYSVDVFYLETSCPDYVRPISSIFYLETCPLSLSR